MRKETMHQIALGAVVADGDMAMRAGRPAEIEKEGFSEYFIYTIEGCQNIPNQWSKRVLSFQARQVDFDIPCHRRPHQYGERPVRFFMLRNDEKNEPGTTSPPDGLVRTFRENGRDGRSFLGQQSISYVPIREDIELNFGTDDEGVWERKAMKAARLNFTFSNANNPRVVGWDQDLTYRE